MASAEEPRTGMFTGRRDIIKPGGSARLRRRPLSQEVSSMTGVERAWPHCLFANPDKGETDDTSAANVFHVW